jgi:hypothetical protein
MVLIGHDRVSRHTQLARSNRWVGNGGGSSRSSGAAGRRDARSNAITPALSPTMMAMSIRYSGVAVRAERSTHARVNDRNNRAATYATPNDFSSLGT